MHGLDVTSKGLRKISGMNVELQDGEDLVQQLLLMEIVDLEGGIHSVHNGMLVHKSWESTHDSCDEGSGVGEIIHDMRARHQVVVSAHAVVKSSNTIDVMDLMILDSLVGLGALENGTFLGVVILLSIDSLDGSEAR